MSVNLATITARAGATHAVCQQPLVSFTFRNPHRHARHLVQHSRLISCRQMSRSIMSQAGPKGAQGTSCSCAIKLILDFDGTLTMKDTMHVLAEAGYARQRKLQRDPQPRPWAEIVDAYMSDFKGHTDAYSPKATDRTKYDQETTWLNSLKPVENASIERAIEAGIFDRMSTADMTVAANEALDSGQVRLRRGWTELLGFTKQHNNQLPLTNPDRLIQVISVNWSACFVRQILRGSVQRASEVEGRASPRWSGEVPVYANELPSLVEDRAQTAQGTTSGPMQHAQGAIRTSGDKVRVFKHLRDQADCGVDILFIYVGDSTTDLECLLTSDVGICIHDDPMSSSQMELAATCERLGVELLHIRDRKVFTPASGRRLLWARDFHEITDWLKGHRQSLNSLCSAAR